MGQRGISTLILLLIIVTGIVVVGGLGYAMLPSSAPAVDTSTKTSTTPTHTTDATTSPTASSTTSSPTSTTEAQPAPSDSVEGTLGSAVTDGVTQITVNAMRDADVVEDEVAGPGNKFLILDISIQNVGEEESVSWNLLYFRVLDGQGAPYQQDDASTYHLETHLYGDLSPGDAVSEVVSYKVPADETSFWLEYQGYYYIGEGIHRSALFSIELR